MLQQHLWNEPRDKSGLSGDWVVPWKEKLYCHGYGGGMGISLHCHCRSPALLSSDLLALSGVVVPDLGLLNLALLGAQQISLPEAGRVTHWDKWWCWASQGKSISLLQVVCADERHHHPFIQMLPVRGTFAKVVWKGVEFVLQGTNSVWI